MSSFIITAGAIKLEISLEEVEKLHIHEEIIPGMLEKLIKKIREDNVFKDPIIVDKKTLVVLDGMHRVAAAKALGFKYIPVCLVDYDDPAIELHAWARGVRGLALGELLNLLKDKYAIREIGDLGEGLSLLEQRKIIALITDGSSSYGVVGETGDIKLLYDEIKKIEQLIERAGGEVSYYTEREAIDKARSSEISAAIIPPRITKDEVRAVALRGEVFVHKATRHIIPSRPMNISVPLDWLSGSIPIDVARRNLVELLQRKTVKRLPPGTVLDRRYDEELFVFVD